MVVLTVRPKVAELAFQVFGRSLHPELFETFQSREIRRGDYIARIDITSAGHVITWMHGGSVVTEVAASAHHPLPQKRRIASHRLRGKKRDQIDHRGGLQYAFDFELESVKPDMFWILQEKICIEPGPYDMLQRFDSSGRMALGAISYIHIEARNKLLSVLAMHTFPDDHAIVKSLSTFAIG